MPAVASVSAAAVQVAAGRTARASLVGRRWEVALAVCAARRLNHCIQAIQPLRLHTDHMQATDVSIVAEEQALPPLDQSRGAGRPRAGGVWLAHSLDRRATPGRGPGATQLRPDRQLILLVDQAGIASDLSKYTHKPEAELEDCLCTR